MAIVDAAHLAIYSIFIILVGIQAEAQFHVTRYDAIENIYVNENISNNISHGKWSESQTSNDVLSGEMQYSALLGCWAGSVAPLAFVFFVPPLSHLLSSSNEIPSSKQQRHWHSLRMISFLFLVVSSPVFCTHSIFSIFHFDFGTS